MKTIHHFKFPTALFFGVALLLPNLVRAKAATPAKPAKTPAPKVTTETSYIGPATEQIVVTEKYKDGTVIRVVQILHQDGTAETRGERRTGGAAKG